MRTGFFLAFLFLCFGCLAVPAGAGRGEAATAVLRDHCLRCHGPEQQESGVRFDTLSTDLVHDRRAAETWHDALNVINAGRMPPEDAPPLSKQDLETLQDWIGARLDEAIAAQQETEGRVVLRRLNRTEYQQTMTDLLGLEMNYAVHLPPDPVSATGFKNDGRALQMSAMELEAFLETARLALDRVIVSGPAPQVYKHEFSESNVQRWLGKPEISSQLGRQQIFLAKMVDEYPEAGAFRVRITLTADLKPNVGFPLLEVSVGYRPDTKILFRRLDLVQITSAEQQTLEFHGRIENFPLPVPGQGKFPGLVVRVRNLYDDGSPLPKAEKKEDKRKKNTYPPEPHLPTVQIESLEFAGPAFAQWPPATHRQILFESPLRQQEEVAYMAEVLERFMTRAFRRSARKAEVNSSLEFFRSIRPQFPSFEAAVRETLAMVLIRPEFLYLVEPAGEKKRSLNDWELASRLSYFLWSTMPDAQLFELADAGRLHEPQVLSAEVDRMLDDPRADRFIEQFTEQWLQLNVLESVAIDPDYHPGFDEQLKQHMRGETQQFFGALMRENRNAMKLLASEFTMLNEPLAQHYGIDGVYGHEFRRVELPGDQHRGGLLGHASILLSNSTGSDSHAVRRAVWIRDRLLNDPPAPPPPDVPSLDEAEPEFHKLSIREQLKIHRDRQACASCHRDIDPWGIALENFNAVGLWREEVRRKTGKKFATLPVDAVGNLPGGHRLKGVEGLRNHLLKERKDDFARGLVSRLAAYALGRPLELSDQPAVDRLAENFAANGYRLRGLIHSIVAGKLFQTK